MQAKALEALCARRIQFVAGVLELVFWILRQVRLLHPDLVWFQLSKVNQNFARRALTSVDRSAYVTAPVKAF